MRLAPRGKAAGEEAADGAEAASGEAVDAGAGVAEAAGAEAGTAIAATEAIAAGSARRKPNIYKSSNRGARFSGSLFLRVAFGAVALLSVKSALGPVPNCDERHNSWCCQSGKYLSVSDAAT